MYVGLAVTGLSSATTGPKRQRRSHRHFIIIGFKLMRQFNILKCSEICFSVEEIVRAATGCPCLVFWCYLNDHTLKLLV